jgi:hypothetical protein
VRTAGARARDYNNAALQQAAAGPKHLYCGQCCYDSCLLSQVAVAVGQAKGSAALSAAEAGTDYSSVLKLLVAVLRVSCSLSAGWRLKRLCLEQQARGVGHR